MKIVNYDNIFAWAVLISSIAQVIITGWAYSLCFKIKVPKLIFTLAIVLVSCITIVPPLFFQIYFPMKAITLFSLTFVVFWLMSESNFVKSFIFCCFDMLINVMVETLLVLLTTFIGINDFQDVVDIYSFNRMSASLMFTVVCIPFKYLLALLWNKVVNKGISSKLNISLILFPAAQTFAMVGMIADHLGNAEAKQHPMVQVNSTLLLTLSLLTFIIADVVYMFFMSGLEKKTALELEVNSLKHAHELEEQHFKQIEEKRYEVAKIRHDINNQLIAIRSMMKDGYIEQADQMLGVLEDSIGKTKEYQYCSIPVVNAVLSEKVSEAEKYGIKIVAAIYLYDTRNIVQNHLCSAFTNMIDNAIRAESGFSDSEIDKKVINISAVNDEVSVYITVKNYISEINSSRKDDSSLHGYDQKILGDIANMYSGSFTKNEKNGEYTCTLILRMSDEQTDNL